ncbi:M50 family metallopeptidase [Sphingomonas sp. JC676]|uniref:site-2 protease family protein n=1 Tax=Sphingomonas sp. JC676 TaxID=2768065 RepID=UPI001657D803|nr:site-2 protease family protein [Sphingomonas sp. JC676]MBC9031783.1 M50 family metallopeptidase [Sphingomonas sp. JC676]
MRLIAKALFLIVAVVVMATLGTAFPGDGGLLIRILLVALLSFVATLVHELGHAAAAQVLGGQIREIVVLPFAWRPGTRRLRMRWRAPGGEIGGYVAYALDRIDARRKHMLIALAGPAANLLLAAVTAFAASYLAQDHAAIVRHATEPAMLPSEAQARAWLDSVHRGPEYGQIIAVALAILSGGIGLVNLLPFDGSDGAHILRRMRARPVR